MWLRTIEESVCPKQKIRATWIDQNAGTKKHSQSNKMQGSGNFQNQKSQIMNRKLPQYKINGIEFIVDVEHSRLIERSNPENSWNLSVVFDHGTGYSVHYNGLSKKLEKYHNHTEHSRTAYIPYLSQMDPIGMAEKYGVDLTIVQQQFKKDLDIILESPALIERIRKGKQPELEIGNHTFFVNTHMGKLESLKDPLEGISFHDLRHNTIENGSAYRIAFNSISKEYEDIDLNQTKSWGKHLMIVEFPHEQILDPVGYARDHGLDLRALLMKHGFTPKRKANILKRISKTDKLSIFKDSKRIKRSRKF
jgi:hypothetical protein